MGFSLPNIKLLWAVVLEQTFRGGPVIRNSLTKLGFFESLSGKGKPLVNYTIIEVFQVPTFSIVALPAFPVP